MTCSAQLFENWRSPNSLCLLVCFGRSFWIAHLLAEFLLDRCFNWRVSCCSLFIEVSEAFIILS